MSLERKIGSSLYFMSLNCFGFMFWDQKFKVGKDLIFYKTENGTSTMKFFMKLNIPK
jgi:hypothetical protein